MTETAGEGIDALPGLPQDAGGPVFREPWEAEAFAMAVRLSEQGLFTWREWAETLSAEITKAQAAGDRDLGDTYYRHWLNALEALVAGKGLVARAEMDRRKDEWMRAYRNTPHGRPVALSAATPDEP